MYEVIKAIKLVNTSFIKHILGDRFSPKPAIHSFFNQVKAFRLYF